MRVSRVLDLSVPVGPGTVVYPGDPQPVLSVHSTLEREGFNLLVVAMGSQTGTHVDAPYHVDAAGTRVSELPLGLFLGPAVVVDASLVAGRSPITWREVSPVADLLGPGVVVLLRTDWSARYGEPAYFEHPYLEPDACRRMLAAGVRTFGIDAPSIDPTGIDPTGGGEGPAPSLVTHRLVASAGGVVAENLRNLALIDWDEPFFVALPLLLEGADGAPVRAVALEIDA